MSTVPNTPLRVPLLAAETVDETLGARVDCSGRPYIVIYVSGAGTTSSGVITIEEADIDPVNALDYTGTWSSLTTVNASDVSGGKQAAIHLPIGAYAYIRTRISTVIGGGGTISAVLRAS